MQESFIAEKVIKEHKHRLARESYIGKIVVTFTICVSGKKRVFLDNTIYRLIKEILLISLSKYSCCAHVYLMMPDHCHFLIEGKSKDSDLWKFIVGFKQRSGYWFSENKFHFRWQKDFYDHILRRDEDILKQVQYILENPVRKKMVSFWREYPFKGSTMYNLDDVDW